MKFSLFIKIIVCALLVGLPASEGFAAAGKFNFVAGDVRVINMMGERKATRGSEVEEQEIIVSGKNGMAQLRMSDGAFIAVRANTELRIDKYKYDGKANASSESVLSLLKGTLRAFTGAIAGFNKDKFKMKTLGATIGIRGSGNVLYFSPTDKVTLNHTIAGSHTVTAADPSGALRTLVTNPGQTIQINALGAMKLVATPAFILDAAASVPDSRPQQMQQQNQQPEPGTGGQGTDSKAPGAGEQGQATNAGGVAGRVDAPLTGGVQAEARDMPIVAQGGVGQMGMGEKGTLNPADSAASTRAGGALATNPYSPTAEMLYADPAMAAKYAGVYNASTLERAFLPIMPVTEKYDMAMGTAIYEPGMLSGGYQPARLEPVMHITSYAPTTYIARYGYDASGRLLPGYILVDGIPRLLSAAPYGYQYDFYGKLVLAQGFALDASGIPYPTGAIANYGYTLDASGRPILLADYALDAYGNPYPVKMPPDYGYTHDTFGNLVLAPGFSYVNGVPTPTKVTTLPYGYGYDTTTGALALLPEYSIDVYGNPYVTGTTLRYGYTHDWLGNWVLAPGFALDASGTPYSTGLAAAPYGYTYLDGKLVLQAGYVLDSYGNPYLRGYPPPTGYTYNISGVLVLAPGYTLVDGVPTLITSGGPVPPFGYFYDATGALRLQAGYSLDAYGNPYPDGYLPAYGYTYDTTGTLVLAPGFTLVDGEPQPTTITFATPGGAPTPRSGYMYDAFAAEIPIPTTYRNIGYMNNLNGTRGSFFEIALNDPNTVRVGLDGGLLAFQAPLDGITSKNAYQLDIFKAQQVDLVVDKGAGMLWGRWQGGHVQQTQLDVNSTTPIDQTSRSLHWFSTGPQTQAVTLPVTGTIQYTWIGGTQPTDNFGGSGSLNKAALSANFSAQTVDVGLIVSMPASTTLPPVSIDARASGMPILPGGNFMSNEPTVNCSGTGCASLAGSGVIGGQFSAPNGAGVGVGYGLNNGSQTINGVAVFRK